MQEFDASLVWWCLGAIQTLGLASAAFVRWSEGRRCQIPFYCVFLGCLGLVGLATVVALAIGPGCCVWSGTTLAVMAVTVTLDTSRAGHAAAAAAAMSR